MILFQVPRSNNMSEAKSGGQNGTSRGFEIGSELQICPIVVEDLQHPGHMLIEVCWCCMTPKFVNFSNTHSFIAECFNQLLCPFQMLCDEHGLFLDIAQAIRRLELTILKGVMETRSSNVWAHFVVEV